MTSRSSRTIDRSRQLRRYLHRSLAEIKFIINCLPKRALASNRCDRIDSIFHDEFPVESPLTHRHAPSHSHGENTQRCVCLTYFHSTVFHFLSLFLRRHGVEERRRTKRNQQGKWKMLIIDFLNVILRLPCLSAILSHNFSRAFTHTHSRAPALGRCWSRSREDFRALAAPSHLISLAGVRRPCRFAFVRV